MENIKMTNKMIIALILISIGIILLITSFFVPDPVKCNTGPIATITSSMFLFAIGMLLLMMGIALADTEYRRQTNWVFKKTHKSRKY